jgi:hypothetical protein
VVNGVCIRVDAGRAAVSPTFQGNLVADHSTLAGLDHYRRADAFQHVSGRPINHAAAGDLEIALLKEHAAFSRHRLQAAGLGREF